MKKHLIKINKKGNASLYLHKRIYSSKKIAKSIKDIEGANMDAVLGNYYRLVLETNKQKEILEFCNFLFSEHR
ncbi:MAG: hypothetical protein K9L61_00245 [Candidatus Omnitrophica bacterium]|nr:hypothetical protein [Candidatus Omnitrophota bacterium]